MGKSTSKEENPITIMDRARIYIKENIKDCLLETCEAYIPDFNRRSMQCVTNTEIVHISNSFILKRMDAYDGDNASELIDIVNKALKRCEDEIFNLYNKYDHVKGPKYRLILNVYKLYYELDQNTSDPSAPDDEVVNEGEEGQIYH